MRMFSKFSLVLGIPLWAALVSPATRAETMALTMGTGALVCATHSGTVRCWGTASNSALGSGTPESNRPVQIALITDAIAVAVGVRHACALRSGGGIKCWGDGQFGQVGNAANPSATNPVDVVGLSGTATAIALNNSASCALMQSGAVQCFGSDAFGQLGNGPGFTNSNTAIAVLGISNAVAISAGATHFCAALADGSAKCWGDNNSGQLGDNSLTNRETPTAVSNLSGVQTISGGEFHTCAATSGGLKCWGNNLFGQLGDGTFVASLVPVASSAVGSATITRLIAGGRHNCAQLSSGSVSCWGRNFDGQLGQADNSVFNISALAAQGFPGTPIGLAAGNATTCARFSDNDIRCFGSGTFGQLGDARTRRWKTPVDSSLPVAADLDMGSQHTCARSNSSLQCLGFNGAGALGDGSTARRLALSAVVGSSGAGSTLAASETQTCNYIANSSSSQCWGRNESAQLGTAAASSQEASAINAPIFGAGRQFVQIALGTFFGCALLAENDGAGPVQRVRCWGRNNEGQLGNGGTSSGLAPSATVVSNLVEPIAIGAGELHACALENAGTIKCWGNNGSGRLGTGDFNPAFSPTPLAVIGISNAVQLVVGRDGGHACARLSDGSAKCWGFGNLGQLGNSAFASSPTPVVVTGLTGTQELIAGNRHSCALLATAAVKCWGANQLDQIGTPPSAAYNVPTTVTGLGSAVLDIAGGAQHSCARLAAGWKCWGYNGHGELGNGLAGVALLPVRVAELGTLFVDDFE